jgi:hypothetical protein
LGHVISKIKTTNLYNHFIPLINVFFEVHGCEPYQHNCFNPSLGLATKVRAYKVVGQEGSPGVASHDHGSARSVREWTLTLPSELPLWELESQMDPQIFKAWLQGSKPISFKKLFISLAWYWNLYV